MTVFITVTGQETTFAHVYTFLPGLLLYKFFVHDIVNDILL